MKKIIKGIKISHCKYSLNAEGSNEEYETKKNMKHRKQKDNLTLSVKTLNVNGLNNPIKRQRLSGRFKKTRSNYMLSTSDIV